MIERRTPRATRLRIVPVGNVGNQMLQYMAASQLRAPAGIELCGYDMPMWGLSNPCGSPSDAETPTLTGTDFPVRAVAACLRLGLVAELNVSAVCLDVRSLGHPGDHQLTFTAEHVEVPRFGDGYVIVSVRGAETLTDVHRDYGPLPIPFLRRVIDGSGKVPVFMGQLGDDRYSTMLRESFPDAVFQASRGPLVDFETLRAAREIVVAVSTFSWLAAWLSSAATIHVPVLGFLNPRQRPDIHMLPLEDERYRFYVFGHRHWRGTSDDFATLTIDDGRPVSPAAIRALRRRDSYAIARSHVASWVRLARLVAVAGRRARHSPSKLVK